GIISRILKLGTIAANTVFAYEAASATGYHVPIKPTGFPDFADFLYPGFRNTVFIPLTGSRRADERAADAARGARRPFGYTWHHHEVMGIMQLVRRDIHSLFFGGRLTHQGGVFYYGIMTNNTNYRS